jgi:hypothetical protein
LVSTGLAHVAFGGIDVALLGCTVALVGCAVAILGCAVADSDDVPRIDPDCAGAAGRGVDVERLAGLQPLVDRGALGEDDDGARTVFAVVDHQRRLGCHAPNVPAVVAAKYSGSPAVEILEEGVPIVEMPQSDSRIAPASETWFELIREGRLVRDGDADLRRQIVAAVPLRQASAAPGSANAITADATTAQWRWQWPATARCAATASRRSSLRCSREA